MRSATREGIPLRAFDIKLQQQIAGRLLVGKLYGTCERYGFWPWLR